MADILYEDRLSGGSKYFFISGRRYYITPSLALKLLRKSVPRINAELTISNFDEMGNDAKVIIEVANDFFEWPPQEREEYLNYRFKKTGWRSIHPQLQTTIINK